MVVCVLIFLGFRNRLVLNMTRVIRSEFGMRCRSQNIQSFKAPKTPWFDDTEYKYMPTERQMPLRSLVKG